jgi:hypothetical protein
MNRRLVRALVPSLLAFALGACVPLPRPPWEAGKPEAAPLPEMRSPELPTAADSTLPADPEAAYRWLSTTLLAASTVNIAVQCESSAPYPSLLTGTLTLGASNELALSMDGEFAGQTVNLRLRSTGGKLTGGPRGDGDTSLDLATPPALREAVVAGLLGMGLLHNLALLSASMPPDHATGGVNEWLVTSNHTWDTGKDAVVDGRAARALSFDVSVGGEDVADATLWLDAATGLPVKRVIDVRFKGEASADGGAAQDNTMHATETYLKFEVTP